MNIMVVNGTPAQAPSEWHGYLDSYEKILQTAGHTVKMYNILQLDLKYCTGCWMCWWGTPGRCILNDDMELLYRSAMAADIVVFASPMVLGFVSAETKKVMDRMIPLLTPYMDIVQGEMHHRKRYAKYPQLGVLLHPETDTDSDDLKITEDLFRRFALNFRTELAFMHTTDAPYEEVAGETCGA